MRKFLEVFLFYKYPSHTLSFSQRLDKFFDNDSISINLINRVVNEYSHFENRAERGLEPIDTEAISKIAQSVLSRIKNSDPHQYEALLQSIEASN